MAAKLNFHLITICGGSASGKSSVIRNIRQRFPEPEVCIISLDDYYKVIEEQYLDEKGVYNFDLPGSIDIDALARELQQLSGGQTIDRLEYTFNNPGKVPVMKHYYPAPVVIVEGLFACWFSELREKMDFSVFIDADERTCYNRRRERDLNERAIPGEIFEHQWKNHVLPAYNNYLKPFIGEARLVINNNSNFSEGTNRLAGYIRRILDLQSQ